VKIPSVRGLALTLALFAIVAFGSVATADTMSTLVAWAENAPPKAVHFGEFNEVPTSVVDEFKPGPTGKRRGEWGLGAHGTFLETAEAGSTWVYDYAHHIAADSDYGGFEASMIFYAPIPPPSKITSRDLSAVSSVRGLKLGMSPQQAAHDLAVPITSVSPVKIGGKAVPHYSVLSVNKLCPKPQICGHGAIVFFEDNRAIAIEVGIAGP
jgi:hypothetical protein